MSAHPGGRDDRAQAGREAQQGRDRGQAVAAGTRRGVALRAGLDRLHGPLPLLRRIHDGVCLAVDPGAQRATFAVPDVLPDGVLRGVRYWPRAPRLGEALPVFVGEEEWVWCEPPSGTTRWLYFRARSVGDFTVPLTLWRVPWPLTADSVAEVVATTGTGTLLDATSQVFLACHAGTRSLYWHAQPRTLADWSPTPVVPTAGLLRRFADWGFGAQTTRTLAAGISLVGTVEADDARTDPDTLAWTANRPVAGTHDYGFPPGSRTASYIAQMDLLVSGDGAQSWTTARTVPYLQPVLGPTSPPSYLVPSFWPPAWHYRRLGATNTQQSGFLLSDPGPLGGAGTAVIPWPAGAQTNFRASVGLNDASDWQYALYLAAVTDGSLTTPALTPLPYPLLGGADTTWRQGADGTFRVFTALRTSAPVDTTGGWVHPYTYYRGAGPLDALVWAAVGGEQSHPVAPPNPAFALAAGPAALLAVSADGADLVAAGQQDFTTGTTPRLMSTDAGTTWTVITWPPLVEGTAPAIAADLLFVDIPTGDPFATEQP